MPHTFALSKDVGLMFVCQQKQTKIVASRKISSKALVLSLKVCKYSFYSLSFHSFFIFSSFHFLN